MPDPKLAIVGDIMLGRGVAPHLERNGPKHPWGDVLSDLRDADTVIGNLECVLSDHTKVAWPERPFHFRVSADAGAGALSAGGFAYVSLANNHALDYGPDGLMDTIATLDTSGIRHAGGGKDLGAAMRPTVVETQELRIGFLSASDHPAQWRAGPARPGTFRIDVPPSSKDWDYIRQAIRNLRRDADLVVVSLHWGPNMRTRPSRAFEQFGRAIIDAGADLIHGHSAHVFQPVVVHRGGVILYDCGDFVDDYAVDPSLRNDFALLHHLTIDEAGGHISDIELLPCQIDPRHGQVNHATQASAHDILGRAAAGLDEFKTPYEHRDGRLAIQVA